ncbi:hypothetical protein [Azospirillum sp. TSO22-1]|uniref:hypothetical protein n=1 Tax=Azospirillum sp. TSO22-1 TaxID=716789 RepID=UPI000D6064E3|nr:hypothetical protein [Azospirillum sp. TSO22-1]PWC54586.1 hypothetical protein TSO221_08065 [Azospirillum sp. TSO22-1]
MALSSERIEEVVAIASRGFAAGQPVKAVVQAVKEASPGLTVTGTFASIMAEDPYREEARFDLFLVDGSGHCWTITEKPESATGVVIAEHDEE